MAEREEPVVNAVHIEKGMSVVIGHLDGNINLREQSAPAVPQEVSDRTEFLECAAVDMQERHISFSKPPGQGAFRHVARFPGKWTLLFRWGQVDDPFSSQVLRGPQITNVRSIYFACGGAEWWLADLARPDTGMTALEVISFASGLRIASEGIREIARPDSGLSQLKKIYLGNLAEAECLIELARPDSGLKSLTYLDLGPNVCPEACFREFGRPDSGLKYLQTLKFGACRMEDANTGLGHLTRSDTGLGGLKRLLLCGNQDLTDAGITQLASARSGLKNLDTLDLRFTGLTDAGMLELARSDASLAKLKTLRIELNEITDATLEALARPDAGLPALAALGVNFTRVTDQGVAALQKARPALKIYRESMSLDDE